MARKGSLKVKTGCVTCKIRKIKCDEGKPACVRCTSTGRNCDGYPQAVHPPEFAVISWQGIAVVPSIDIKESDARSLDYFRGVVGPAISGKLDSEFWNRLVLQAGSETPAIRHATLAISSLYESFGSSPTHANHVAVQHYNRAIRAVMSTSDQHVALLACVLFVCIEFLMGNSGAATDHCGHGISILNAMMVNHASTLREDSLLDIFCRLSLFPFFFGSTPLTFPILSIIEGQNILMSHPTSDPRQLQRHLDILVCRIIRLIRNGDKYRLGGNLSGEIPGHLLTEQNGLELQLQHWEGSFHQLKESHPSTQDTNWDYDGLEMKFLVARIWARNAFSLDETAYDAHVKDFRRVVHMGLLLAHSTSSCDPMVQPKFRFEMGLFPLLYFVAIKCRTFDIRMKALNLMNTLGVSRENLWDRVVMDAVARRIIELEHGVCLAGASRSGPKLQSSEPLTHSAVRIMDSIMSNDTVPVAGSSRRVTFFLTSNNGTVNLAREWVSV